MIALFDRNGRPNSASMATGLYPSQKSGVVVAAIEHAMRPDEEFCHDTGIAPATSPSTLRKTIHNLVPPTPRTQFFSTGDLTFSL